MARSSPQGMGPSQFWFARRFPVGNPRNAMVPVSREGWLVVLAFIASMILGAVAFAALAINGDFAIGAGIFGTLAILGGGGFIAAAQAKGDTQHTAEDYAQGRVGKRTDGGRRP